MPKLIDKKIKGMSNSPASTVGKPGAVRRLSTDNPPDIHMTRNRSKSESSNASSPAANLDAASTPDKKKSTMNACPCIGSSSGKDWKLKCLQCGQIWHAGCANLKGTRILSETTVNQVFSGWLCPWCYKCPFPRHGGHTSSSLETSLVEKVLSTSVLQRISDTVTAAMQNITPSVDITSLEAKMNNLQSEIKEFHEGYKAQPPPVPQNIPLISLIPELGEPEGAVITSSEKPFEVYKVDYLTVEEEEKLDDFVGYHKSNGSFFDERGHMVLPFGEPYRYTGSGSASSAPEPIPEELKVIIDKVTKDLSLKHKPNSVLINYFPAGNAQTMTHLAMHSDDETCIVADSKIITLSLWASRKIVFHPKHQRSNLQPSELVAEDNSLYVMTRSSQNWFKHGVPQPNPGEDVDERISITLRCINNKKTRSILLMGDSNTKEVKFGEGSGTVGASYPGRRVKANMIKDIDPEKCVGYQNVFLHCGTNDLRNEYVTGKDYIHKLVGTLQSKLCVIEQLCPNTNVFVVPVLPTRNHTMNENVMYFNKLVDVMLNKRFPNISFSGVYGFLDSKGLLDSRLMRSNSSDDFIHLGKRGIAKYVAMMKSCVYRKVKSIEHQKTKQESAQVVDPPGGS
ncbi:hypothetical protein ACHWQZ_G009278 [Mnemiopsis leidyi]